MIRKAKQPDLMAYVYFADEYTGEDCEGFVTDLLATMFCVRENINDAACKFVNYVNGQWETYDERAKRTRRNGS